MKLSFLDQGYHGDPFKICSAECTSDSECPSYKPACVYNACINPCTNACGYNADCNLRGLTPVCSCPKTMTGDPFTFCRPFEARKSDYHLNLSSDFQRTILRNK